MTTKQTRLATVMGGALLAGVLLTGCTGDEEPKPGTSSDSPGSTASSASSSPTAPAEAELKDRSSEVLADPPSLTVLASTPAKASSSFRGSSFTVHAVTRTDTATILTYSVTGGAGHSSPSDSLPRSWEKSPVLVTPTHAYRVVTFQEESKNWAAVANPTYRVDAGTQSGPLTVLYPPLPKGTAQVTLRGAWFNDVKVAVTDVDAS